MVLDSESEPHKIARKARAPNKYPMARHLKNKVKTKKKGAVRQRMKIGALKCRCERV